jgi:hypothetical protein
MTPLASGSGSVRRSIWLAGAIFAVLAGLLLLHYQGRRFIYAYADTYETVGGYLVLLCAPAVLYWMKGAKVFAAEFGKRYPTSWLRRWVAMPLLALAMVAAVVAAPFGWFFAAAALAGGEVEQVRATAVEVDEVVHRRKGCDQEAVLRFGAVAKDTCLDGLFAPSAMRVGQQLDVGIIRFSFGFKIVSIAPGAQK